MRYRRKSAFFGPISGAIILISLVLSFAFDGFNLPIFFTGLAFAMLVSALSAGNMQGLRGGVSGFIWMIALALFFITHVWLVFIVAAALTVLLNSLLQSVFLTGPDARMPGMYTTPPARTEYQAQYGAPQAPQEPYQPYEQGYQQSPQPDYAEGGKQYYYPTPTEAGSNTAEQPQVQYPQQMPPQ